MKHTWTGWAVWVHSQHAARQNVDAKRFMKPAAG